jgi:hypothetical protein
MTATAGSLALIKAGDRWRDSDGGTYVVAWVAKIGVVAYRREGAAGAGEAVLDAVRFVTRFAPVAGGDRR